MVSPSCADGAWRLARRVEDHASDQLRPPRKPKVAMLRYFSSVKKCQPRAGIFLLPFQNCDKLHVQAVQTRGFPCRTFTPFLRCAHCRLQWRMAALPVVATEISKSPGRLDPSTSAPLASFSHNPVAPFCKALAGIKRRGIKPEAYFPSHFVGPVSFADRRADFHARQVGKEK